MSMIPGGGSQDFYDSIPSGPETDPYSKGGSLDADRPNRMRKFGKALEAAAAYKQKKAAENEADAEMGKNGDDDDVVGPKGFKISNDATVVTGYRDPGFTLQGQQGRSLLGPIGAGVGIFNPALGRGISAVGSLTGL
tara:strand:- start:25 stop:435 length:411 start_codon:yes stop_codon:yes gene_type:complete